MTAKLLLSGALFLSILFNLAVSNELTRVNKQRQEMSDKYATCEAEALFRKSGG